MGCWPSKAAGGGGSRASQVARWRSTGIVALSDSKLKTLPNEVLELHKFVRTLDLTCNRIVEIPAEITKLVNMQRLILSNNLIESLPMNMGNLLSLKYLNLDGNRLTTLPDELGLLLRLERLSVKANMLKCLPETVGSLHNLQLLNVSENRMNFLPESIGNCASLEELHANGNLIQELPVSICTLNRLKSLTLDDNNLRQLPVKLLKNCSALQNLSLHGNSISMDQLQQMEGFQDFEVRRKKKFDKQIDSNVMMSSTALDEGVDL